MYITIQCDRCRKFVDGILNTLPSGKQYTSGYYIVNEGYWKSFSRPNEINICDECIHSDTRYHHTIE